MHLTVLSRSSHIYTTRRLVDAARVAGHRARVLDPLRCEMFLDGLSSRLFYRQRKVARTDACIPRIAQSVQSYGLAVVDQFAHQGVPLLNNSAGIARSRNKIRCLQHLSSHGVPVPATAMASEATDLKAMVSLLGGVPVLLKLLHGGERVGVMVCESLQSLEAALEALLGMGHNLLVQQYVPEAKGRDLRALVVGGRLVAAARRLPRVGRLGRTLGAGARFEPARLRPELARLVESSASLVGLEVAAIDLLDTKDGPRVFEVNSSPGIKEIEEATGVDIAAAIVGRAADLATGGRRRPRSAAQRSPRAP